MVIVQFVRLITKTRIQDFIRNVINKTKLFFFFFFKVYISFYIVLIIFYVPITKHYE
jgi:hypothetical protein